MILSAVMIMAKKPGSCVSRIINIAPGKKFVDMEHRTEGSAVDKALTETDGPET